MKNLVSSGHPLVTETAIEILKSGGNAFDAACAAAIVSTLAESTLTSLGGGGFMLAHTEKGESMIFDFFPEAPGLGTKEKIQTDALDFFPVGIVFLEQEQIFNIGSGAAAVPGLFRGILTVHERLGSLPLKAILEPAIHYSRQGIEVNDFLASTYSLLEPIITHLDEGKEIYSPGGKLLAPGDLYKNSKVGDFLENYLKTGEDFYTGPIAAKLVKYMEQSGGLLTTEDLQKCSTLQRSPLKIDYRGYELLTNPLPSFGGPFVALSLRIQEELEKGTPEKGSTHHFELIAQTLKKTQAIRHSEVEQSHGVRISSGGTTHFNIQDAKGNAVSLTMSNGEGCGTFIPDTGIMLNNMLGEDDLHPNGFHEFDSGMRISSMMAPSMLIEDGHPALILGSGGSKRIRTSVYQVISHWVDQKMRGLEAVDFPRLYYEDHLLHVEPGIGENVTKFLDHNWKTNHWREKHFYFGGVHTIENGTHAIGDPRRGGSASVC